MNKKISIGDDAYMVHGCVIGCGIEKISIKKIELINNDELYYTTSNNEMIPGESVFKNLSSAKKEAIKRARSEFNFTVSQINSYKG